MQRRETVMPGESKRSTGWLKGSSEMKTRRNPLQSQHWTPENHSALTLSQLETERELPKVIVNENMNHVFLSTKCCMIRKHWVFWSVIHARHTHPISYLTLLLGRKTFSCRILGFDRGLQGFQSNLLLGPGAVRAGCPEPCPTSF